MGIISLFRVLSYKLLVKYRFHKVVRISESNQKYCTKNPNKLSLNQSLDHFFFFNRKITDLVSFKKKVSDKNFFLTNWFDNYIHSNKLYWYEISDFNVEAGDIKGVWELSRWYWAIRISCNPKMSLSEKRCIIHEIAKFWKIQNPFLRGPNWKCGQEVSLRLIHYLISLRLLDRGNSHINEEQKLFVSQHLQRIEPTLSYAKGQKNNHWISEAVALIIGGLWLGGTNGQKYFKKGTTELFNAINILFNVDGSFAQSSFNYLRHVLTLIAISRLEILSFGEDSNFLGSKKLSKALNFYSHFTKDRENCTHNWGANDGSNPLAISGLDFLDPLAHKGLYDFTFFGSDYFGENQIVKGIVEKYHTMQRCSTVLDSYLFGSQQLPQLGFSEFSDGGLIFYRTSDYRVLIRLPKFNFKPSQDDVGHFDVIYKGNNCILDAGTYSYFTHEQNFKYFQGIQSHNTTYRATEPYSMSKLSRFIFGCWSYGNWEILSENELSLTFKNCFGDVFNRYFLFRKDSIEVSDNVISSSEAEFKTGITINNNEASISHNDRGHQIEANNFEGEMESLSIFSTLIPDIVKASVSYCYGSVDEKVRLIFPLKNRKCNYAIQFR